MSFKKKEINSKNFKVVLFVLFLSIFISSVSAQLRNIENQIDEGIENLENNITKIKEFTQKDKWDFIGSQWKDIILKNKLIKGTDTFFTNIDIVFVILFGMHWSLSLQMYFAILLWIFIFISLKEFMSFTENNSMKWFYSFLGVVLIAQINLFEKAGNSAFKLMFYKDSILWKTSTFMGIILLLVLWYKLDGLIAAKLKHDAQKKKESKNESNQEEIKQIVKSLEKIK